MIKPKPAECVFVSDALGTFIKDTPHSGPEASYYKCHRTEMIQCIILDQNGT